MPKKLIPPEEVLAILAAGSLHIASLAAMRGSDQLRTRPAPEAWSAVELLAHLRACADVWGDCIAAILAEDHPTIRAINPGAWIEQTDYAEMDFEPSFRAFTSQRTALLVILTPLSAAEWERAATVTGAGRPMERTAHFYAQWLGRHERTHLKQMARIVESLPSERPPGQSRSQPTPSASPSKRCGSGE